MDDLLLDVPPAGHRPGNSPCGSARPSVTHGNEHEFVIDNMVCCNAAQEAQIQEASFEFDRLLGRGEATGKSDFAFHREIAAATNNSYYVEVLDALGMRAIPCDIASPWGTDSTLSRDYPEGLQRGEHLAILRAISAGDPEAARAAMRAHLTAIAAAERPAGKMAFRQR
ncbi:FadR family transcriptional regulator [Rhizobium sp. NZLR1b]|nr:FadR family transcriptional regulator [Rhizobium sp. NZLR1b]